MNLSSLFGSSDLPVKVATPSDPREVLASVGIKVERLQHREAPQDHASFSVDGRQAETHHVEEFMNDLAKAIETDSMQAFKAAKFPRF